MDSGLVAVSLRIIKLQPARCRAARRGSPITEGHRVPNRPPNLPAGRSSRPRDPSGRDLPPRPPPQTGPSCPLPAPPLQMHPQGCAPLGPAPALALKPVARQQVWPSPLGTPWWTPGRSPQSYGMGLLAAHRPNHQPWPPAYPHAAGLCCHHARARVPARARNPPAPPAHGSPHRHCLRAPKAPLLGPRGAGRLLLPEPWYFPLRPCSSPYPARWSQSSTPPAGPRTPQPA